jgi:hypothetical protein
MPLVPVLWDIGRGRHLERMRELRTLTASLPQACAEVDRHISDLMSGTRDQPWQGLILAA